MAILPEGVEPNAADKESRMWYGVYIKTRWDTAAYSLVAWCYTKEQALEVLDEKTHRKLHAE